jgi:hypothetical protein
VLQLWHVGRISHPSFQPGGAAPVAPSAIRPNGQAFTEKGFEPIPTPRALETAEIPAISSVVLYGNFGGSGLLLTGDSGRIGLTRSILYAQAVGISLQGLNCVQVHKLASTLRPSRCDRDPRSCCVRLLQRRGRRRSAGLKRPI